MDQENKLTVGKIVQLTELPEDRLIRRWSGRFAGDDSDWNAYCGEVKALRVASWVDMVREFHKKHGILIASNPQFPSPDIDSLRQDLHIEELNELHAAIAIGDLVEVADAIADLVYVLVGTALCYGIPLDEIFAEVHRSNMTKDGTRRADGKILKGDKFEPPRIKEILDRYATVSATTAVSPPADHTIPE